jgi:hypothetical protein
MIMTVSLFKAFAAGEMDYIAQLNNNAELIEATLNQLLAQVTGQSGALAVPIGLQQIFDRPGLIGISSYDFPTGGGASLIVAPGAYWDGGTFYYKTSPTTLSLTGAAAGTYYVVLDAAGNPAISANPGAPTLRQFAWSGSATSAEAIYAGVAILLSGADYADMLTSIARTKTFTKVADRLEEIEVLLGKNVQTPASADSITINWSLGGVARVVLNRATTTFHFTGGYDCQKLVLELIQDEVGGRAVAFGAEVLAGSYFTFPVLLSSAGLLDYLGFIYKLDTNHYDYTSLARGYTQ